MVERILAKHNVFTFHDLDETFKHNSPLVEELYNYFLESGEMPYGVAKARTGDPLTWMFDRVAPLLEA